MQQITDFHLDKSLFLKLLSEPHPKSREKSAEISGKYMITQSIHGLEFRYLVEWNEEYDDDWDDDDDMWKPSMVTTTIILQMRILTIIFEHEECNGNEIPFISVFKSDNELTFNSDISDFADPLSEITFNRNTTIADLIN